MPEPILPTLIARRILTNPRVLFVPGVLSHALGMCWMVLSWITPVLRPSHVASCSIFPSFYHVRNIYLGTGGRGTLHLLGSTRLKAHARQVRAVRSWEKLLMTGYSPASQIFFPFMLVVGHGWQPVCPLDMCALPLGLEPMTLVYPRCTQSSERHRHFPWDSNPRPQ